MLASTVSMLQNSYILAAALLAEPSLAADSAPSTLSVRGFQSKSWSKSRTRIVMCRTQHNVERCSLETVSGLDSGSKWQLP
ncbi:hypothetical protein V8C26DRAFT_404446 [Trichoderma gracile]